MAPRERFRARAASSPHGSRSKTPCDTLHAAPPSTARPGRRVCIACRGCPERREPFICHTPPAPIERLRRLAPEPLLLPADGRRGSTEAPPPAASSSRGRTGLLAARRRTDDRYCLNARRQRASGCARRGASSSAAAVPAM